MNGYYYGMMMTARPGFSTPGGPGVVTTTAPNIPVLGSTTTPTVLGEKKLLKKD